MRSSFRALVLFLYDVRHKKKSTKHTRKKMNVSSTHAVALHGMNNARGSQRTTSASTSSLIARKNTRSYNTKKNINTARHHQQRSIIRYARDNNCGRIFRRFLTAPSSKDDDGVWVYDVNDESLWLLGLLSSFSCSSFRVVLHHRRLALLRGKAAAASAREESFPCSFFKGII